ncbi:hypothetical protein B7P43_G06048 [Cryptotermes secundus]|nr:hypothetical protein B7P43_G06048 [Cryptotermes secundus]
MVGSRQDVAKSPRVTESEQSETENSPVAVKDSVCGSESEKEQLSAEERTANCESDVSKQISPKSIDTKVKYVPPDVKTPKLSPPQCSLSEINSKKNTANIERTPSCSHQNSFCDCNFEACTPDSGSPGSTQKIRKLTPKQLLKQLESAKKKEEKERQRQEREKKKAEEKEEREKKKAEDKEEKLRQKLEKEEQKKKEKEEREEQKRKEREEKEELKKKEKEEKEKKKQVELEIKNEEKRKKEDKRQAEAAAFTSFFLPKKAEPKPSEEPKVKAEENFMPFEVKADMRLAPSTRKKLTEEVKRSLDQCVESQSADQLYLDQIRSKQIIPQTSPCTWALSDFKDDVIILDDDDIPSSVTSNIVESYPPAGQLPHPKLLQFWENRRPPYWGTWRKRSQSIGPRNPFSIDVKFFDYEVDSDDEWEEEEPGESLHGSDDEKESEDEYEVDNEFFVPHGYLSDEENTGQEDEDQSPEMLKIKLKLLELEFEEEMKQKTERLKPRLLGCIWIDSKTSDYAGSQLLKLLSPYQAVYQNGPIVTSASDSATAMGSPESSDWVPSPATPLLKKKKRKFPEAAIPALIKLIHGNVNRCAFLVKEFLAYWDKEQQKSIDGVGEGLAEGNVSASPSHDIFKKSVSNKIKELATWLACPDAGPMNGRTCWYVPSEIRAAHGLPDITLPNTLWDYTFKPKRRESDIQTPTSTPALGSETNPKQLITKFTKKMTEVECRKQFSTAPMAEETPNKRQENGSSPHNDKTQKKLKFSSSSRAFTLSKTGKQHKKKGLVSLPKGQELPKACNNSLMKFMKQQGSRSSGGNRIVPHFLNSDKLDHGGEECIVLSD